MPELVKKNVVRGVDVLIFADGELIAGQRNCDYSRTADTLDTTTKDDDGFKTYDSGLVEAKVSLENVSYFGQNGRGQVIFDKKMENHEAVLVKINVKGKKVISGYCYITSASDSGQYTDVSSNSYELVFCTKPTTEYAPFLKTATFSGTTVTLKLTEAVASVTGTTLKDMITVESGTVTEATIGSNTAADTITVTVSAAPTAGKLVTIKGGALKNGDAIQAGDLYMELATA